MVKTGDEYRARNDQTMKVLEVHANGSFRAAYKNGLEEKSVVYKSDGTPMLNSWNDFSLAEALCHGATGKIEVDPFKQERIIERRFHPGKKYKTRGGHEAGIDIIRETDGALMGWIQFEQGRTTACWFPDGNMTNGVIKEDPYDLMPSQEDAPLGVTAIEDVTPDRLSVVESSLRDVHRQLQTIRGNSAELIAGMATKIEQFVDRLDGTDRRVEAINAGLKDAGDLLLKHEDRLELPNRVSAHKRIDNACQRLTALEASLARIEDMLTSEKRPVAEVVRSITPLDCDCEACLAARARQANRKSLGWINAYTVDPASSLSVGGTRISGPFMTKAEAMACRDDRPILRHAACVEIFEGDGL